LRHIPYKGAQSFTAAAAGEVPLVVGSILGLLPYVQAHRLVALGVTSKNRSPLLPDLPTVAEQGVDNFDAANWFGILAPKGTPADILNKLNADVVEVVNSPKIREHFLN